MTLSITSKIISAVLSDAFLFFFWTIIKPNWCWTAEAELSSLYFVRSSVEMNQTQQIKRIPAQRDCNMPLLVLKRKNVVSLCWFSQSLTHIRKKQSFPPSRMLCAVCISIHRERQCYKFFLLPVFLSSTASTASSLFPTFPYFL